MTATTTLTSTYPINFRQGLFVSYDRDVPLGIYLGHLSYGNIKLLENGNDALIDIIHSDNVLIEKKRIGTGSAPRGLGIEIHHQPRGVFIIEEGRDAVYIYVHEQQPCQPLGLSLRFSGHPEYRVIRERLLRKNGVPNNIMCELKNAPLVTKEMFEYLRMKIK